MVALHVLKFLHIELFCSIFKSFLSINQSNIIFNFLPYPFFHAVLSLLYLVVFSLTFFLKGSYLISNTTLLCHNTVAILFYIYSLFYTLVLLRRIYFGGVLVVFFATWHYLQLMLNQ